MAADTTLATIPYLPYDGAQEVAVPSTQNVTIQKVSNGFTAHIGCKTFVA